MLKLYAHSKHCLTLIPWGEVSRVGKEIVWTQVPDRYAIPGRKVATENEVRKWASMEGFTVKKAY